MIIPWPSIGKTFLASIIPKKFVCFKNIFPKSKLKIKLKRTNQMYKKY